MLVAYYEGEDRTPPPLKLDRYEMIDLISNFKKQASMDGEELQKYMGFMYSPLGKGLKGSSL